MKGTVKWFNTQKGYGFIVGDDGTDYFVHYSNIKVSEFRHLDAGDHVEFDVETNDKGIQAINVVPVLTMSMIKERAARHNMHLEEAVGCGAMGWMWIRTMSFRRMNTECPLKNWMNISRSNLRRKKF